MTETVLEVSVLPLAVSDDVVRLRQAVREKSVTLGLSLVDQTKVVTAASELARNTIQYGGGGKAELAMLQNGTRRGFRLTFIDEGPGIPDIQLALKDGYTSGGGLGLGLGGAKRLCDEFHIESTPGQGTRISVAKWKSF